MIIALKTIFPVLLRSNSFIIYKAFHGFENQLLRPVILSGMIFIQVKDVK
jgi:hypothetical protein